MSQEWNDLLDEAIEGEGVTKTWILKGDDPCDKCAANAQQGPIDLKRPFASGHDHPLAHDGCSCQMEVEYAHSEEPE